MARSPLPPIAAAVSFIDCINRGDLLDEPPLVGRGANREAWRGYFSSFPDYVIHPRQLTAHGASVAVLGVTTGSHLGLPDDEEMRLDVIWLAHIVEGRLSSWRVADDTSELRADLGVPPTV